MNKVRVAFAIFQFSVLFIVFSNALMGKELQARKETFSPTNPPTFEKFAISEAYKGKMAPLKLNSYPEARKYRTRLRENVKAGPNFAGHYAVIAIGCGTNCQNQWVVNVKSGKILGRFLTSNDAEYRLGSNLLILNPPTEEYKKIYKENPKTPLLPEKTVYMVWEKDKPKVIYEVDMEKLLKVQ